MLREEITGHCGWDDEWCACSLAKCGGVGKSELRPAKIAFCHVRKEASFDITTNILHIDEQRMTRNDQQAQKSETTRLPPMNSGCSTQRCSNRGRKSTAGTAPGERSTENMVLRSQGAPAAHPSR